MYYISLYIYWLYATLSNEFGQISYKIDTAVERDCGDVCTRYNALLQSDDNIAFSLIELKWTFKAGNFLQATMDLK